MKNSINEIDFSIYSDMANQTFPDVLSFNVFDESGKVLWTNKSRGNNIKSITIHEDVKEGIQRECKRIYVAKLNQKEMTYIKYMYSNSEELIGGIAIVVDSITKSKKIANFLLQLSYLATKEVELCSELNQMSNELEERYEELNLVYESEEESINVDSGPELLEKLVTNCVEYLDVSLAALILSKEDITIFKIREHEKEHYIHSLITQLKNFSLPWIEKQKVSIVSNDLMDELRQIAFPDMPYKLICCPIITADNTVSGLLVILNSSSSKDFSNSDRNLLDAIAKKSAKTVMAYFDGLTGLYKRNAFEVSLEQALNICKTEAKAHCLLHIDIDGIKIVNETIDKKAGDYLINEIANILRANTRDADIISRLMGDKFGVLLDSCTLETGCAIADSIRKSIQQYPFVWEEQKFDATACIGVVELNADTENSQSMVAAAELSVRIAKENGRNTVQVYQQGNTVLQKRRGEVYWIREIQKALKHNLFELYCQPIVPISQASNRTHFEILLRLFAEDGSMISPDNFIPAAERFKLMPAIDEWVIENTFKLLKDYRSVCEDYLWAINLSGLSLTKYEIANKIIILMRRIGIAPELISFEITETATLADINLSRDFIKYLKEKGISFALDDFGTGASTFTYLKNLPVDYLKIDGSFIKEIATDPFAEAVVNSITQVSKVQKLQTIAEFVENQEILQRLKLIGVDFAQGYGVGKPVSLRKTLDDLSSGQTIALSN